MVNGERIFCGPAELLLFSFSYDSLSRYIGTPFIFLFIIEQLSRSR